MFLLGAQVNTGAAQRTLQLFPCVCQQFFICISIPTKPLGIEVWEHIAIISQFLGAGHALLEKRGSKALCPFWPLRMALIRSPD